MGPMMDGRGWVRRWVHRGCLYVSMMNVAGFDLFPCLLPDVQCSFLTMSHFLLFALFCMYTFKKTKVINMMALCIAF